MENRQQEPSLHGGEEEISWQEKQQQQRQQERRNGDSLAFNASLISLPTS